MNPKFAFLIFSFKRELKFVLVAFGIAILIPIIAIILLTQIGLDIISDKLVSVNEQTQNVEIHDPVTGEAIPLEVSVSWPTFGVITLEFGQSSGFQIFHTGIDIANANGQIGDPINPFLPGKVIYAGEISWGYGKHIIIDHGNNITSVYAHLDKIFVVKGQEITSTKQVIGRMGSTGWSTGPHLHFEARAYGIPVNPRTFLGNGNP
ncbi:MAG: M23 family metallopeptidase [Candidatus Daviesbacteria bacterium]|nr:M23 family metallopeptidase [Candidatus Daviesbacteria bacterium]